MKIAVIDKPVVSLVISNDFGIMTGTGHKSIPPQNRCTRIVFEHGFSLAVQIRTEETQGPSYTDIIRAGHAAAAAAV